MYCGLRAVLLGTVSCALWSWFLSDVFLDVLERKKKYGSSKPAYCVFVTAGLQSHILVGQAGL